MFKFIEKHLWSQALAMLILSFIGFNLFFILTALITLGLNRFGVSMTTGRILGLVVNGLLFYLLAKTRFADYLKASLLAVLMMNFYVNLGIFFYLFEPWILEIGIFILTSILIYLSWLKKLQMIYILTILYTGILSLYIIIAQVDI